MRERSILTRKKFSQTGGGNYILRRSFIGIGYPQMRDHNRENKSENIYLQPFDFNLQFKY